MGFGDSFGGTTCVNHTQISAGLDPFGYSNLLVMRNGSTQKSRWISNVAAWPQPADPGVCNVPNQLQKVGTPAEKIEP